MAPLRQRPSTPLPSKPGGYLSMESYSSLKRLWTYFDAAEEAGLRLVNVRGDPESSARRRIEGYSIPLAGGLIDLERLNTDLEDGFESHPALFAQLAGDSAPLREYLSLHYDLQAHFTLALLQNRDLILRPELLYRPHEGATPLPGDLTLRPRRFARDELRFMLDRACGLTR